MNGIFSRTKMYRVFFVLLFAVSIVCCSSLIVRQTKNGPIEGIEQTSSLGQKYFAFKGVPYAEPPITGIDPFTGKNVDRRFKVRNMLIYTHLNKFHMNEMNLLLGTGTTYAQLEQKFKSC